MIRRRLAPLLAARLTDFPAVALLGPRQVGKTTLAHEVAAGAESLYLDLESPSDRAKLTAPELFFQRHEDALIVLDEVQRAPELFQSLRGIIDAGKRRRLGNGRFLLLGSASLELLAQSGETLAGRIAYLELSPFDPLEVDAAACDALWLRGGFPESFLAKSDRASAVWRESFVRTYLERDIPQLGPRVPAETLRRFWTMLAHAQGGVLNAANLARGLAVDGKTIARYLDLLVDLLLVRRLPPYVANVGKRLVKSPKIYLRDSGLVHTLLGLETLDDVLSHPVVGASYEGFVIEALLRAAPQGAIASYYRTAAGAEMDLVLELGKGERWAVEVKRGLSPKAGKGFYAARADLRPTRSFVAYSGADRYPLDSQTDVIGVHELARLLTELG